MSAAAAMLFAAVLGQGEPGGAEWGEPEPVSSAVPPLATPSTAGVRAPLGTQLHDGTLAAGGWGVRRYGIDAVGGALRLSRGTESVDGALQGKLVDLALELAIGETAPGLRIWDALGSVTVWSSPRRSVRGGLGLDLGAVSYRRVTTGAWEVGGAIGPRVGLHFDVLPSRDRSAFIELHGAIRALSRGAELSVVALVGLAFRTEAAVLRRTPQRSPEPEDPPAPDAPSTGEDATDPWSAPPPSADRSP